MANAAFLASIQDTNALPGDVRLMQATANGLMLLAVLLFAALALNWAVRHTSFALRLVQVEGDVLRNSASTIRANAAPKLAGNFFTFDLQAGRRAFESVPWVRHALVRRVWPNRLVVSLEEHRPAALWSDGDGEKLVNTFGEVFEANLGDVEQDNLPTLTGPDGSARQMLAMHARLAPVLARMSADGDAHVDALTLSQRGSWRAEIDTGAEIELGRGTEDEVIARTERFIATLPQVTQRFQRPLEYADLRHHEGYAVRLKGVTTTEQKPAGRK